MQVFLALFITFVMPETLSDEAREAANKATVTAPVTEGEASQDPPGSFAGAAKRLVRRLLSPIESLTVFLPRSDGPGRPKNWNMFYLAIVQFLIGLARVSIQARHQALTSRRRAPRCSM